jgi:GntR family transcriptional repressor for pyruvate dehydrogenase complex
LRSRIVQAAITGKTNREIAAECGISERIVGKWRLAFAEKGIDGLTDNPRSGRPPKKPSAVAKVNRRTPRSSPPPSPVSGLTQRLIGDFKQLIASGRMSPGSKLPPERALSLQLGVSRPSLRQALKVMEVMGVLQQRVGDGTYLNSNASEILGQPLEFLILLDGITFHELVEARMIMEPELAARAAERAAPEDLAALRSALKAIDLETDQSAIGKHDIAFHEAIFRAAGNRVCQQMLGILHRSILDSMMRAPWLRSSAISNAQHKRIYLAIESREPQQAYQNMLEHLSGYLPLLHSLPKPFQSAR